MENKNPFTEKCICLWSKGDECGFMPNTECPVHGKETKEKHKNLIDYRKDNLSEEEKQKFREDGILIDDFLEVGKRIEELGLGKSLQDKWNGLLTEYAKRNEVNKND